MAEVATMALIPLQHVTAEVMPSGSTSDENNAEMPSPPHSQSLNNEASSSSTAAILVPNSTKRTLKAPTTIRSPNVLVNSTSTASSSVAAASGLAKKTQNGLNVQKSSVAVGIPHSNANVNRSRRDGKADPVAKAGKVNKVAAAELKPVADADLVRRQSSTSSKLKIPTGAAVTDRVAAAPTAGRTTSVTSRANGVHLLPNKSAKSAIPVKKSSMQAEKDATVPLARQLHAQSSRTTTNSTATVNGSRKTQLLTSSSAASVRNAQVSPLQQLNEALNTTISTLQTEKADLQQEIQTITGEFESAKGNYAIELNQLETRMHHEAQRRQQEYNNQLSTAQKTNEELNVQLNTNYMQQSELQLALNDLHQTYAELRSRFGALEVKQSELLLQNQQLQSNLLNSQAEVESFQQKLSAAQQLSSEHAAAFDAEKVKLIDELQLLRAELEKHRNTVQRMQRERRVVEREKTAALEERDAALAESKSKSDELNSWQAVCELREQEKKDLTKQLMLLSGDVERLVEVEQAKEVLEQQLECASASLTVKHDKHQEALAQLDQLQIELYQSLRERDQLCKSNQELSFRLDESGRATPSASSFVSAVATPFSPFGFGGGNSLAGGNDDTDRRHGFFANADAVSGKEINVELGSSSSPPPPQPPIRRKSATQTNSSNEVSRRSSFSIREQVDALHSATSSSSSDA